MAAWCRDEGMWLLADFASPRPCQVLPWVTEHSRVIGYTLPPSLPNTTKVIYNSWEDIQELSHLQKNSQPIWRTLLLLVRVISHICINWDFCGWKSDKWFSWTSIKGTICRTDWKPSVLVDKRPGCSLPTRPMVSSEGGESFSLPAFVCSFTRTKHDSVLSMVSNSYFSFVDLVHGISSHSLAIGCLTFFVFIPSYVFFSFWILFDIYKFSIKLRKTEL